MRTFHARGGRLSASKRRALAELGPRFALGPAGLAAAAGAPIALEIGAGDGDAAVDLAVRRPELFVVAAEVRRASLAVLLRRVDAAGGVGLAGRIGLVAYPGDGVALLREQTPPGRLALLRAFFPDPWPKRAQQHRRLVQPFFAELAASRLAPGGVLEIATDDLAYAAQMEAVLGARPELRGGPAARAERPLTYYEAQAVRAGRPVIDLRYARA
ncbi:MAG: tRNA (guanine(46)-N(7))-methyltransferase TrmB [Acidimicrobiales bacterium]